MSDINILGVDAQQVLDEVRSASPRVVVFWSGSLGNDVFSSEPHTAMGFAAEPLDHICERIVAEGMARDVVVRTHASQVLSDNPSCLRWIARWCAEGLSLCVDPRAMLTDETRLFASDHLERVADALLPGPDSSPPGVRLCVVPRDFADRIARRLAFESKGPAAPNPPEGGSGAGEDVVVASAISRFAERMFRAGVGLVTERVQQPEK